MKSSTLRLCIGGGLLFAVCSLVGCALSLPGRIRKPTAAPEPVIMAKALSYHEAEVATYAKQRNARRVVIEANDIQLPATPRDDEPSDPRLYTFYIWVDASEIAPEASLASLLEGKLQVEVLGAPATRELVDYAPQGASAAPAKSVIRVRVSADQLSGPITLIAWFPEQYRDFENKRQERLADLRSRLRTLQMRAAAAPGDDTKVANDESELTHAISSSIDEQNPWGERKQIRVYSGDLKAQIYMAGEDEAKSIFGPQFARFFYVGRIFIRNQDPERKLFVYTTSLRANVLFYRSPDKQLAKLLAHDSDGKARLNRLATLDAQLAMQLERTGGGGTSTGLTANEVQKLVQTARMHFDTPPEKLVDTAAIGDAGNDLARARRQQAADIVADTQNLIRSFVADLNSPSPKSPFLQAKNLNPRDKRGITYALQNPLPTDNPVANTIVKQWDETAYQRVSAKYLTSSPLSMPAEFGVNPTSRGLGFSPDPRHQANVASFGYMWRDLYRPMTFQSVLNSLVSTTEGNGWKQTIDVLESLGVVAGGLVGLSSVSKTFTYRSYSEGVAVTSSVVLPEARKLLLDDVNKYVRNLGDMAMDTVISVDPNGVADRYIFFPRGPIVGYGVDEFHPTDPSFIVQIDNNDVAIEAVLVDRSKSVTTGVTASSELVSRTINEGQSQRDADTARLIAMNERIRAFRLSSVATEVQKLMASSDPKKHEEAQQRLATFEKVFGPDTSGTIAQIRVKNGLADENLPPSVSYDGPRPISLREGAADPVDVVIKVKDVETNAQLLKVTTALDPATADAATLAPVTPAEPYETRKFTLKPAADKFGEFRIVFTVQDAGGKTAEVSVPVKVNADLPRLASDDTSVTLKPEEKKTITVKLTDPRGAGAAFRLVAEPAPADILAKVEIQPATTADGVTTYKVDITAGKNPGTGKIKLHATNGLRTTPDRDIAVEVKS